MNCVICSSKTKLKYSLKSAQIYSCIDCNHFHCEISNSKNADRYTVYNEYEFALKKLRDKNFTVILNHMLRHVDFGASGLEVGSALGWFLKKATSFGYKMTGIEPIEINYKKSLSDDYTVIHGYFPECCFQDLRREEKNMILSYSTMFLNTSKKFTI